MGWAAVFLCLKMLIDASLSNPSSLLETNSATAKVSSVAGEATKIGGVAKFIHFNVYTSHLRFVSGVTNGVGVEKLFGALGVETFS